MASYLTHFKKQAVPITNENQIYCYDIIELAAPGQSLVSREGHSDQIQLKAGENTEFDDENLEITALGYGYPELEIESTPATTTILVSLLPLVELSENLMEARLNLFPPIPGTFFPDLEELTEILSKSGVLYGLDLQAVEQALNTVRQTQTPLFGIIIARGKAPIHGKDSSLRMEIEIGPLPGKILANGSIDFRERQMFVGVKEGQLIATKIPAEPGKPGTNLASDPVEARDGKDLAVKVTGDTLYNETDGTVRAAASGVLSVVNDDTLRVAAKQKIEGDVNFSTGNIRSQNSMEITGSVQPEFIVSTKGNLLIGGNVQSATVKCRGNVEVKGGILGQEAQLQARGDIDVKYIERGTLTAEGNIVIRSSSYYSSLQAGGSVHCPEKVKLIGGTLIARGSVSAGQIGAGAAAPMQVAVGVDPGRFRRYLDLMQDYTATLKSIQTRVHLHGSSRSKNNTTIVELDEKLAQLEKTLAQLNLIPDTPEKSLGDKDYFHTGSTIKVYDFIAAGTVIRIGNDTAVVDRDIDSCSIRMDERSGAIIFKMEE